MYEELQLFSKTIKFGELVLFENSLRQKLIKTDLIGNFEKCTVSKLHNVLMETFSEIRKK